MDQTKDSLINENRLLRQELEEYKEVLDAIRNGAIDALAINKNGQHEIFTLESTDFVYRVLVENFGESALNVTENGLIVFANSAFEKLLGLSNAGIIGTQIESLIDSSSKKEFRKLFRQSFSGNSKGEILLSFKNKRIPVYVSLSSMYPKFPGIAVILTDLSEKKQREIFTNELAEKIEERTSFIQQVLDSSVELISTFDKDLRYTYLNKNALNHIQKNPDEVIGKHVLDVFPFLEESSQYTNMKRALKGETVYQNNIVSQAMPGVFYESYLKPLIINGEITGVLLMARDITQVIHSKKQLEDMNRELEHKNIELTHSNTELASFSYIASHDLQEPLRKIRAFTGRILEKQKDELSDVSRDYFNRITAAATSMQNLIDALHSYSRASVTKDEPVLTNLNITLEDVKRSLAEKIKQNDVVIDAASLPTIKVIPLQIYQVFVHLINNAIKFRKKRERPFIKITSRLITEAEIEKEAPLPKRKYWKISIQDNGIGFEQVYQHKIFELFQRLHGKDDYTGTGIGLAICKKIIQNHNGLITASAAPGEGAAFHIYLPNKV